MYFGGSKSEILMVAAKGGSGMIENISCQDFSTSIRKIYACKDRKRVTVTLGYGSYIVGATLSFSGLHCHVLIGNYSSIGHGVRFIVGLNHNSSLVSTYPFRAIYMPDNSASVNSYYEVNHNQVIIGHDVWIGAYVTILGGVRIGNGAVIGADAVVAEDVPPYAVVAGNPARVIKYRFSTEAIDNFQRIKWWNWDSGRIKKCWREFENTEKFLHKYAKASPSDTMVGNQEMLLALQELRRKDYNIYYFQPDLCSEEKVWQNVLKNISSGLYGGKSIFVVEVDEEGNSKKADREFFARCRELEKDCVILLDKSNAAGIVKLVDFIIITKEYESLQLIDMAGNDCKILYGYDRVRIADRKYGRQ